MWFAVRPIQTHHLQVRHDGRGCISRGMYVAGKNKYQILPNYARQNPARRVWQVTCAGFRIMIAIWLVAQVNFSMVA